MCLYCKIWSYPFRAFRFEFRSFLVLNEGSVCVYCVWGEGVGPHGLKVDFYYRLLPLFTHVRAGLYQDEVTWSVVSIIFFLASDGYNSEHKYFFVWKIHIS